MKTPEHDLRCVCSRAPLLATYGLDKRRRLFVHVKIWKQKRIYGELYVTGGTIRLLCRECFRWHRIVIRQEQAVLSQTRLVDEGLVEIA